MLQKATEIERCARMPAKSLARRRLFWNGAHLAGGGICDPFTYARRPWFWGGVLFFFSWGGVCAGVRLAPGMK